MQWLQNNGLWILFVLVVFGMHMFGHGGHGHGGHRRRHGREGPAGRRGSSSEVEPRHHAQPTARAPSPWQEG